MVPGHVYYRQANALMSFSFTYTQHCSFIYLFFSLIFAKPVLFELLKNAFWICSVSLTPAKKQRLFSQAESHLSSTLRLYHRLNCLSCYHFFIFLPIFFCLALSSVLVFSPKVRQDSSPEEMNSPGQ